ncbi:MAG: GTP-sensing pleiotropic transcriptional regulator CodY [Eubacteriales bacterium]
MHNLLEKIRNVNKVLQFTGNDSRSFFKLSEKLSEVMQCNVYIANKKGQLLGYSLADAFRCEFNIHTLKAEGTMFPQSFNDEISSIQETVSNKKEADPTCVYDHHTKCGFEDRYSTFVPINSGEERLGTLVLAKFKDLFTIEDLIVAEVSATVVGMEMMRTRNTQLEEETRFKSVVQMAIGTLSYSELEAVCHIFRELDGDEGLLVASKIADRVGITRSVIVNALRKLESAAVIETRSLGMKGTFIKILNPKLIDALENISH